MLTPSGLFWAYFHQPLAFSPLFCYAPAMFLAFILSVEVGIIFFLSRVIKQVDILHRAAVYLVREDLDEKVRGK